MAKTVDSLRHQPVWETRGVPPTTAKQEPDGGGKESHYQTLWGGGNLQTSPPVTLPNGAGGLWERFQQPPLFFLHAPYLPPNQEMGKLLPFVLFMF